MTSLSALLSEQTDSEMETEDSTGPDPGKRDIRIEMDELHHVKRKRTALDNSLNNEFDCECRSRRETGGHDESGDTFPLHDRETDLAAAGGSPGSERRSGTFIHHILVGLKTKTGNSVRHSKILKK